MLYTRPGAASQHPHCHLNNHLSHVPFCHHPTRHNDSTTNDTTPAVQRRHSRLPNHHLELVEMSSSVRYDRQYEHPDPSRRTAQQRWHGATANCDKPPGAAVTRRPRQQFRRICLHLSVSEEEKLHAPGRPTMFS